MFPWINIKSKLKEETASRNKTKSRRYSSNDQSINIQMMKRRNARRFSIGKRRNRPNLSHEEKDVTKLKKRSMSLPYNAYSKFLDTPYLRRQRRSIDIEPEKTHLIEGRIKASRELTLQKFKDVVRKVKLLLRIFQRIFHYAMEKGQHDKITSDPRLRLKGHQEDFNTDKDVLFDPDRFKTDFQGFFPKWAKIIARNVPEERTEEEVDALVKLLRQLKEFRRYTPEMQRVMCKVVKYDRFDRHRVIIRKGHVGECFYIIYSGKVCFTLSEDDHQVFSKPTEYYNLYKGDSFGVSDAKDFGNKEHWSVACQLYFLVILWACRPYSRGPQELALLRGVRRSATIVCLQRSEFLFVEKEDFYQMGIVDILRTDMESRIAFLRGMDLFSTWSADMVCEIAGESRSLEFRSDLVVDRNLIMSDMMYIITKGKCHLLRLLDLTNNQKWVKRRRQQKKLYSSVVPDTASSSCSRQGAWSRLSAVSNTTGYHERKISRLLSDPQLPGKTTRFEVSHPRMVKSAFTRIARKSDKKPGSDGKELKGCSPESCASRTRQIQPSARDKSACSKAESEISTFGVGVFLRLDVMEKGEIAGLQRVLRTEEEIRSNSNTDTRNLSVVSKGCQIISLPVEVLKKHADVETICKIRKQIKNYPNDDELLDCYLEKSNWNTYKEVLLSKMVKEIEKRKSRERPGTLVTINTKFQCEDKSWYTVQGQETAVSHERARSVTSRRGSLLNKVDHVKFKRRSFSPSPIPVKSKLNDHSIFYPYKPSELIYAQGSHRNLVLVNGGIRNNTIQEEVEEHLLYSSPTENNCKKLLPWYLTE